MTIKITSGFEDIYSSEELYELLSETMHILMAKVEAGDDSSVTDALLVAVMNAMSALDSARYDAGEVFDVVTKAMRERDDEEA